MQPIYFLINETMGKLKYQTEEERKEANRERKKRYYQENREKMLDYRKRYYQANSEKVKDYQKQYNKQYIKTPMGRAVRLVSNYQRDDKNANRGECTLTAEWIIDNIFSKPCHYCGKEGWNVVGCDRLDNSKPHTEDNVIPCCDECNVKRNRKTYEKFLMTI